MKNLKVSTEKLLEPIINSARSQDTRLHKNQLHFDILTDVWRLKFKTILFIITAKKMYASNKTHIAKIIYAENCKMLMKEIKEDLNRETNRVCEWQAT